MTIDLLEAANDFSSSGVDPSVTTFSEADDPPIVFEPPVHRGWHRREPRMRSDYPGGPQVFFDIGGGFRGHVHQTGACRGRRRRDGQAAGSCGDGAARPDFPHEPFRSQTYFNHPTVGEGDDQTDTE